MNISGRVNAVLKNAALWAGLGTAVLFIALAGLGFMTSAFHIWMLSRTNPSEAAVITGGALLGLAILTGTIGGAVIRKSRKRPPSLLSEFGGTIGLAGRLVGLLVRKDPRKAIVISVIAGALAEYLTASRKE